MRVKNRLFTEYLSIPLWFPITFNRKEEDEEEEDMEFFI